MTIMKNISSQLSQFSMQLCSAKLLVGTKFCSLSFESLTSTDPVTSYYRFIGVTIYSLLYSLWSEILATLLPATRGLVSAIHIELFQSWAGDFRVSLSNII